MDQTCCHRKRYLLLGRRLSLAVLLLSSPVAPGKDKKKAPLPEDVLKAHTVWVIVDPTAGVDIQTPNANRIARADVEKAFVRWGRLEPVTNADMSDLIVVVRKGNGKVADGTIGGTPVNTPPPVIVQSTDSGIHAAGGTRGARIPDSTPDASASSDASFPGAGSSSYPESSSRPSPQAEIGVSQDMFVVYRSRAADALNAPPVWRYTAKDALESPDVPAVEVFRTLIAQSEKQLATKP
jgi:hypothetical protein